MATGEKVETVGVAGSWVAVVSAPVSSVRQKDGQRAESKDVE